MKGAFELSLSFIVIVVIAVILLSLAITFLQGIFSSVEQLTYKITDVAREKLLGDLASSGGKVGLAAPAVTEWKRGQTGSFALGIRNLDPALDKTFYISIYLESLGGELSGTPVSSKQDEVAKWITPIKTEFVEASGSKTTDIIIKPPATASLGIYLFRVIVCETPQCTTLENSPALYGSGQFALEIVS